MDELKNIKGQLKYILSKVEGLISHHEEAPEQQTNKTLHTSGKFVRRADSTSTYGAKHDIHRARKKARRNSEAL